MTQNCRGRYCGPRDAGTGATQAHEKREAVRRRQREADKREPDDDSGLLGGLIVRIRDADDSDDRDD
ncbi:MAG TPA: hypothetical protein VJ898_10925 [Natrialbaceae archaeon]|nr:hypothetical protein [Natrialbaceae archaeon]